MKKKRNSASKSAKPALIPQPNGKGALYAGGVPGNVGGKNGGRPANVIRNRLLGSFEARIPVLEGIADGVVAVREKCPQCGFEPDASRAAVAAADQLRAIDMMARHGFGEMIPRTEVVENLKATITLAEEIFDADAFEQFIEGLKGIWRAA